MVRQLERDLPELLNFFSFPNHLCRSLRNTNVMERCLWKCGKELGAWFALSMLTAWIGSFSRSSTALMKIREIASSELLHKQLDITLL
jgi:hypothetical protein